MKFAADVADIKNTPSECAVVGAFNSKTAAGLTPSGARLDRDGFIRDLFKRGDFDGALGDVHLIHAPKGVKAERVLLVGLGAKNKFNAIAARTATAAAMRLLDKRAVRSAHVCLHEAEYHSNTRSEKSAGDKNHDADLARRARNVVEAIGDALYQYDKTKSDKKPKRKLQKIILPCASAQRAQVAKGIQQGEAIARGVNLARDYANLPGNICTPTYLAAEARRMAKRLGIAVKILDEAAMKKLKMGSLLSVSRGSREPAKLIIMQYKGGARGAAPVVLVGKGLTFDAGGISIKPSTAMDEMKFDMCGGASVFGAMQAAVELKLKINLIGIVPSSENLPDGAANKPGDIVTAMNGTTIEILNTDAEGRLILCDALTYAERYKPSVVIDIATLTGACAVALGAPASGLFTDSESLADALLCAGTSSGDRAWRLPLWDEYAKQLKSNFADLANIGGRYAGAVTAACFLHHFTGKQKYDWAHLDVAGTAWHSGANKGASGRPVPLLVEFLLGRK